MPRRKKEPEFAVVHKDQVKTRKLGEGTLKRRITERKFKAWCEMMGCQDCESGSQVHQAFFAGVEVARNIEGELHGDR